MSDEPSLPPMPSQAARAVFGAAARKRVRLGLDGGQQQQQQQQQQQHHYQHHEHLFNSSDPAVFSSDDDPALDNYAPDQRARRRKKRYVGAWFAQRPDRDGDDDEQPDEGLGLPANISPLRRPRKRALARQDDSGVWVGDDVDVDVDMDHHNNHHSDHSTSSPKEDDLPPRTPPPRPRRVFQRVPSLAVDRAEATARALIQTCVETGNEEVALIDRHLTTLSDATIEPLSRLVPIPLVVAADVPFTQKEPALKIFLSSNRLRRLPAALFDLQHLTVLSLRGNDLRSLSPAVGRLRALRSLNVSLNALRALPMELLALLPVAGQGGCLEELLAHPNPFYRRGGADDDGEEEEGGEEGEAEEIPRPLGLPPTRVARSPVHYRDGTGGSRSAFCLDLEAEVLPVVTPSSSTPSTPPGLPPGLPPRLPSLLALALATCYHAPQLPHLPELLPPDAPPHLAAQLARAQAVRAEGGQACSVCGSARPLVQPMTEWVEWYAFAGGDLLGGTSSAGASTGGGSSDHPDDARADTSVQLPFVFRGCSWGCVPGDVQAEERVCGRR